MGRAPIESPSDGGSFDAGYGSAKRVHSTAPTGSRLFGGRPGLDHPIVEVYWSSR
jgi:hypothetical protein